MAETGTKDAIALLKADHRAVEELFEQFQGTSGEGSKQKLAHDICLALSVHAQIEEEIFYPACKGRVDEDTLKEAYVEHDAAKLLIAEIEANEEGDDEFFDAKVHVLQEEIEHHIKEEEKRMEGVFAQARKAGLDTDALGQELAVRKEELTRRFEASGIPAPQLKTMDEVSV